MIKFLIAHRFQTLVSRMMILTIVFVFAAGLSAAEVSTVRGGTTTFYLDAQRLADFGVSVAGAVDRGGARTPGFQAYTLPISDKNSNTLTVGQGVVTEWLGDGAIHMGDLALRTRSHEISLSGLALNTYDPSGAARFETHPLSLFTDGSLEFVGARIAMVHEKQAVVIHTPHLTISTEAAEALGRPELAGQVIGRAITELRVEQSNDWGIDGGTNGGPAAAAAPPPPAGDCLNLVQGPDVIVGALPTVASWGPGAGDPNDPIDPGNSIFSSYAVGTTSCNMGDTILNWFSDDANHPVISENIFRLRDGRFEQLGQSWLKHGFLALTEDECCTCTLDGVDHLSPGCADTYWAGLNGLQNGLGPRSEVNPVTGLFVYPPVGAPVGDPKLMGRIIVLNNDLKPSLNVGAQYFVDAQYITADDALAGNDGNNASYRTAVVSGTAPPYDIITTGTTHRASPAIQAWQDSDPSVVITPIDVLNDGRLILGAKVTNNMDGKWTYEYALQNYNSDRSVGSFSVPHAADLTITNVGFHDVDAHSGEPYAVTDWPEDTTAVDSISWATDAHSVDPNANAIHWGTLYNFRFTTTVPPASNLVTIGLFKPGTPTEVSVSTLTPMLQLPDCNGNFLPDDQDIASGTSSDINGNFIPDECEDCNINGIPDDYELAQGLIPDCNANGVPDDCDVDPTDPDGNGQIHSDCNSNGVPDECETDCNANGIPDACDIDSTDPDGDGQVSIDCNNNGVPDECETDCNANGVSDGCDIDPTDPDGDGKVSEDCNLNGLPDECEADCNSNGVVDDCDIDPTDPDGNGKISGDCNTTGIPDECELIDDALLEVTSAGLVDQTITCGNGTTHGGANPVGITWLDTDVREPVSVTVEFNVGLNCYPVGTVFQVTLNEQAAGTFVLLLPPSCFCTLPVNEVVAIDMDPRLYVPGEINTLMITNSDTAYGITPRADWGEDVVARVLTVRDNDCNRNDIPDECEADCDADGMPDECEIDCNANGVPDDCEVAAGTSLDCNANGVPDVCDIDSHDPDSNGFVSNDCNGNGTPDECEADCDADGIPDDCEVDCNANGVPDDCDVAAGTSLDCNANGVPDACDIDPTDPDTNGAVSNDCNINGIPDECEVVGSTTFDITEANLLQQSPICGFLSTNGFSWVDTGTLDEAPVVVELNIGLACDPVGSSYQVTLNNMPVSSFTPSFYCFCASTAGQLVTVTLDPAVYVRGGLNELRISHTRVFSFTPNVAWGGALARVTVETLDCDVNGIPDSCDLADCQGNPACGDCNVNGRLDSCDIASGASVDATGNGIPDECEVP